MNSPCIYMFIDYLHRFPAKDQGDTVLGEQNSDLSHNNNVKRLASIFNWKKGSLIVGIKNE